MGAPQVHSSSTRNAKDRKRGLRLRDHALEYAVTTKHSSDFKEPPFPLPILDSVSTPGQKIQHNQEDPVHQQAASYHLGDPASYHSDVLYDEEEDVPGIC